MSVSARHSSEQHQLLCGVRDWQLSAFVVTAELMHQLRWQRTNNIVNRQHSSFRVRVRARSDVEWVSVCELRTQLVQVELRNWRVYGLLVESSDTIDRRNVFLCLRLR